MMVDSSKYQLLVSSKCSCCDKILTLLKKEDISVPIINVDEKETDLPFSITILPALLKEKKLIGYGCDDIINQLQIAT